MKQFLTFFLLLLTIGLFAQPVNDDCAGIIDLGVAPACDSTLYNNVGATQSDIGVDNFNTCFVGVPGVFLILILKKERKERKRREEKKGEGEFDCSGFVALCTHIAS